MPFKVSVIYFGRSGRLVTLSNVIAEGARSVEGADVTVYRIRDPVHGDIPDQYDEGVLDAPVITPQVVQESDCVIVGGPGRQGGVSFEIRHFLDSLADFQTSGCLLKGKVASGFTSTSGAGCGYGGHEAILMSMIATFLQHGMVPLGVPPSPIMEDASLASPFGTTMNMKTRTDKAGSRLRSLSESEVKLAYSQGEWAAQVSKQLHDSGDDE
mmetsp:Transcript_25541/g.35221  ORF Transcript_25541/g.35221 Transcript_25541/m.35221 type:complete len:212 (+) Transcript_25541:79-714(+)|eukprot:CAMPEP_0196583370 /NCGR_PEP_ID=MMETSP1081-20130531/43275_1 /TAXON_ID=36882 /ORGANISM="Pyramimonas amylifera, Strain CCMP720" /LENGTH=211 /DNA_ID=CAMNT_0041904239 /DNA_START=70 /DNA_END=705 /DNA_ORIENTATION=-